MLNNLKNRILERSDHLVIEIIKRDGTKLYTKIAKEDEQLVRETFVSLYANPDKKSYYIRGYTKDGQLRYLHQVIAEKHYPEIFEQGKKRGEIIVVDHKNHNRFDNDWRNLQPLLKRVHDAKKRDPAIPPGNVGGTTSIRFLWNEEGFFWGAVHSNDLRLSTREEDEDSSPLTIHWIANALQNGCTEEEIKQHLVSRGHTNEYYASKGLGPNYLEVLIDEAYKELGWRSPKKK